MRITVGMSARQYGRNLNAAYGRLNYYSNRATTFRKFDYASEDPIGATKTFNLRREFYNNVDYQDNTRDAESQLLTSQSTTMRINEILQTTMTDDMLSGINGTMATEDRQIIATNIKEVQKSLLARLNDKFSDRYMFAGAKYDEAPFTLDNNGALLYRDVNVDTGFVYDRATNQYLNPTPADPNRVADRTDPAQVLDAQARLLSLSKEAVNIDLGLGLKVNNANVVNEQGVFDVGVPGIRLIGFGVDATGKSNNMYNQLTVIAGRLESGIVDGIEPHIQKFNASYKTFITEMTVSGAKANFLEYTKTGLLDVEANINKKVTETEYVKPEQAIMDMKMQEFYYNAALQMGTKILQPTFLDFMR